MTLISINPFTDKVIKEFSEFSEKKVEERIIESQETYKSFRNISIDDRKQLMLNVVSELRNNKKKLRESITLEMGKPITQSIAEVEKCAWVCEHYAHNAEIFLQTENIETEAYMSYVCYEPLGPILGIMPWNFPFWQVFRFVAPAIMAGNVVLIKHASNTQQCAQDIENVFLNAGFPQGVYQNLVIGSDKVAFVIDHPMIKGVTLTGSEEAGKIVAKRAGHNIKKSVLELGGNNAFIVLNDADIDKTVDIAVNARMLNAGQSCIAAKRFFLHEIISDMFIEKFKQKVENMKIGDPMDENVQLGPLSSKSQADVVDKQVKQSLKMGAKLLTGGNPSGSFYPATIVTDVKPGMPLFDEEVFGPVTSVTVIKDVNQAIELSNHSKYGLGISLFTKNIDQARQLVPRFDDGAVFINELVKSDPRLPFGGTKNSGYGRELSVHGIREFLNIKTVYVNKF